MKTNTSIIALLLLIGLFTACTDKKKTEEKEMNTEVISEEKKTVVEDNIDEDAKRIEDSIRQVKEHGHAH